MISGGFIPSTACDADSYLAFVRGQLGFELTEWQVRFIRDVFAARSPDDRLTAADIERDYGVRRDTVKQWTHRGKLRPVGRARLRGGPWLYRRHDVEHVIAARGGDDVSP